MQQFRVRFPQAFRWLGARPLLTEAAFCVRTHVRTVAAQRIAVYNWYSMKDANGNANSKGDRVADIIKWLKENAQLITDAPKGTLTIHFGDYGITAEITKSNIVIAKY